MKLYIIHNLKSKKYYIGVTKESLQIRLNKHFSKAYKGSHIYFAKAIRKYGKENFKIEELMNGTKEDMYNLEEFIIKDLWDTNLLYNTASGGKGGDLGPIVNKIHSINRRKQIPPMTGKTQSKETKKLQSINNRGKHNKISEKDVIAIWYDKRVNREIAMDYPISEGQVRRIKKGLRWKYITNKLKIGE
jgi:group I intron endonuclease